MVLKTKRQAYVLEAGNLCTWMMIVTKNGGGRRRQGEVFLRRTHFNFEKFASD